MKTVKNKRLFILGIILIILSLSIAGLLKIQFGTKFASANTAYDNVNQSVNKGLDVIDYNGIKVLATYEFVKINESECSVRINNKADATTAYIPKMGIIEGKEYTVTEIAANGFLSCPNLRVVNLSNTITKIGNMAFANCSQLKYVDLFNVEELGNSIFYRCPNLDIIFIPRSVKVVGTYLFRNNNTQVEIRASEQACSEWVKTWNSNNVNQDVHYESKLRRNFQAEIMYDNLGR